jgi:hypothetical protein
VAARRRHELPTPQQLRALLQPAVVEEARVAVIGAGRYHRPHCQAVTGKPIVSGVVAEHEEAGRAPCGLCSS